MLISTASAYTLITSTNVTTTTSATSLYFNLPVNLSILTQNTTQIMTTNLYLNYSLLREGVTNVSITNDYENFTLSDGGNYTFNETAAPCTPALANITGAWTNTTACNTSNQWDVIRYITEYDVNACAGSTNTTYNETNTTACSYCWPLNTNLTLGQTFNLSTSCFTAYNWTNGSVGAFISNQIDNYEYEANKMLLGAIILLPMLLAFLLLIISNNLDDEHTMFKVFLNLMSFPLFLSSMYLGVTMIGEYLTNYTTLGTAMSNVVYVVGMVFFVVLVYYMIWLTRMTIDLLAKGDGT